MTSGIGLSTEGREGPAQLFALAEAADELGVDTLWLACHLFQRDPVAQAAAVLARTRRLKVALMAMSPYALHPVYPVMSAATLAEMHPGRVVLSFGVGAPGDLASAGIEAPHPLQTMRETFVIARQLLAGESAAHEGARFRVTGRKLLPGPRPDVPVALTASGPKMLLLAADIADGVVLSSATSVEFVRACVAELRGRRAGGAPLTIYGLVHCAPLAEERAALDRLKPILAFILRGAHHARNLALAGSQLDQAAVMAAIGREDWAGAAALVGDEVVRRHAALGPPDAIARRLAEYRAAGLDEIVLSGLHGPEELRAVMAGLGG
ncbi:LLM class flavin-dependent oxidoreductase [Falsiroseomonas oryzae]|uniref:LLM class flavin-dependent oxidoreductase n=1 Tax=Falsiroseomonas oryzae TaxID=2766473 RepID=UPI0022EA49D0|nr:LLM class flavin-dependent oxidoreductase [Roseomonas sp. MO-31]